MKTMKEIAQLALDVQNASNLSGIVHSFSEIMPDLRARLMEELGDEGFSTDKLNMHHVCILFSDKIASLTYSASPRLFSEAYAWAQEQAVK